MFEDHIYRLAILHIGQDGRRRYLPPSDYLIRHSTWADKSKAEERATELNRRKPDVLGKYTVVQFRDPPKTK